MHLSLRRLQEGLYLCSFPYLSRGQWFPVLLEYAVELAFDSYVVFF